MEKSSESEEFGPTSLKRSYVIHYPLVKWSEVMHASKTAVNKQHVKETTGKIWTMAIALDNKPILCKLSNIDIV